MARDYFFDQLEFTFQILVSDTTAANLAIITWKRGLNGFVELDFELLDRQLSRHLPVFGK